MCPVAVTHSLARGKGEQKKMKKRMQTLNSLTDISVTAVYVIR